MTDTKAGLLPCPFCGGHDTGVCENSQTGKFTPVCASCGAGLVPYDTQEKAIEAWNDRPSSTASAEVDPYMEAVAAGCYTLDDDPTIQQASGAAAQVPDWTQMAQAMQRIGACGTEDEIASLLCNAAAPQKQGA